jgi:hypothetical protein
MALHLLKRGTTFGPGLAMTLPHRAAKVALEEATEEALEAFELKDGEAMAITLSKERAVLAGGAPWVTCNFSFPYSSVQGDLGQVLFTTQPQGPEGSQTLVWILKGAMGELLDEDIARYVFEDPGADQPGEAAALGLFVRPLLATRGDHADAVRRVEEGLSSASSSAASVDAGQQMLQAFRAKAAQRKEAQAPQA